jgi:hypothetical protein
VAGNFVEKVVALLQDEDHHVKNAATRFLEELARHS